MADFEAHRMPTDLLHDVFGALTVRDLWSLARTNRFLRDMLLSPRCAYLCVLPVTLPAPAWTPEAGPMRPNARACPHLSAT
jgi:hypothetical protein